MLQAILTYVEQLQCKIIGHIQRHVGCLRHLNSVADEFVEASEHQLAKCILKV